MGLGGIGVRFVTGMGRPITLNPNPLREGRPAINPTDPGSGQAHAAWRGVALEADLRDLSKMLAGRMRAKDKFDANFDRKLTATGGVHVLLSALAGIAPHLRRRERGRDCLLALVRECLSDALPGLPQIPHGEDRRAQFVALGRLCQALRRSGRREAARGRGGGTGAATEGAISVKVEGAVMVKAEEDGGWEDGEGVDGGEGGEGIGWEEKVVDLLVAHAIEALLVLGADGGGNLRERGGGGKSAGG